MAWSGGVVDLTPVLDSTKTKQYIAWMQLGRIFSDVSQAHWGFGSRKFRNIILPLTWVTQPGVDQVPTYVPVATLGSPSGKDQGHTIR